MDCSRGSRSIDAFLLDWECRVQAAESHGLQCTDELKSFMLIRNARLAQSQRASLLLQMEQALALQPDPSKPLDYGRVMTMVRAIAQSIELGQEQRPQPALPQTAQVLHSQRPPLRPPAGPRQQQQQQQQQQQAPLRRSGACG